MQDKKLEDYSKEELISIIKSIKKQKKFGLVWEDKPEKVATDCKEKLPVLNEDASKAISKAPGQQTNIIIEGDNYHSLSALNYTHAGKIDVIYIDPPYNTGNKDFKYNDRFVDSEDSYRHSKWLSFMQKRLELSKNLLANDGIIFISIDDNELSHLKILCDEIFGESNFVQIFIWHKKTQPSFLSKTVANVTEYIVCYKKNQQVRLKGGLTDADKAVELLNISNGVCERTLPASNVIIKNEKYSGSIKAGEYGNGELKNTILSDVLVKNGKPSADITIKGRFKWSQEKINEEVEQGATIYIKSTTTMRPTLKRGNKVQNIKPPISLLSKYLNDIPTNTDASNELKAMFNGVSPMDFPKPSGLIKYLVEAKTFDKKDACILDFFAGSGTTGQAVLELNKADGGNRQFIICTNNESKIAESITYPRICKVIDGYKNTEGIPANVRYFKTGFIEKEQTLDKLRRKLSPACEDMIRVREGVFNKTIDEDLFKVFEENGQIVGVIYDRFELEKYIDQIEELETDKPVHLYVFSYDNGDRLDEVTKTTKHEYESQPIPEGVLEIYKKIFKDRRH
ncbi:MAG: site-specific DNA-methyltransferase [bacterium]|nr:site-specific DNA-methyltransferase [bacterium]